MATAPFTTSGQRTALSIAWLAVLWLLAPLAWSAFLGIPYFLVNARGLQVPEITLPILSVLVCAAVVLCIPKLRSLALVYGTGGFLVAAGIFLSYYSIFKDTAGFALLVLGMAMLQIPSKNDDPAA